MKGLVWPLCILALLACAPARADGVEFIGRYTWDEPQDGFGGYSGLEVSADGRTFTVVSDKGGILQGHFERENGRIVQVVTTTNEHLRDRHGTPLKDLDTDAEGLALAEDGSLIISFEHNHRVARYPRPDSPSQLFVRHADFRAFQLNSAMEAIAIAPDGTLYTLQERSGAWERPFPLYRHQNGQWDKQISIPRRGRFLPVGADFGPDGALYLLERDFVWHSGFASRIRRFTLTDSGIATEATILESYFGKHGNLEGLAVWQDEDGRTRLTMVADDNFNMLQVTEFVEYARPMAEN